MTDLDKALSEKVKGQRWVVKIGSALITNNGQSLARESLQIWVKQIARLHAAGAKIVLVSSGSVAEGMYRMRRQQRPDTIHELQAAAAIGQAGLIQCYESRFAEFGIQIAQVLLVHADLSSRTRYLNARQAVNALLDWNVIPIVNENDTVATDEIRFGDNDTLAGLVSNLVDADHLLILTDQQGVYSDDPRNNSDATLISESDVDDPALDRAARGSGSALGRGGMATKIKAARLAARSGTTTYIANGRTDSVIERLAAGEPLGTRLTNRRKPIAARKQWLAGSLEARGDLVVDDGAARALRETGVSLLPVGVTGVQGNFRRGELVRCIDREGVEIARGLCNYSAVEAQKIAGNSSNRISEILGYSGDAEMIHRDDLVLI